MIQSITTPKNTPINLIVITFLRSMASGSDSPTTPIINAIAVPKGIPLSTKPEQWAISPMHWNTWVQLIWWPRELQKGCPWTYIFQKNPQEHNRALAPDGYPDYNVGEDSFQYF